MKAKVNLYNRHCRIDTYQISPYSTVIDGENKSNNAYCAEYNQACLLLQTIRVNGHRKLNPECILHLATSVAKAWETDPSEEKIDQLRKLMSNLLDKTLLCPDISFDQSLKQFCANNVPTHSVSPSVTLLVAISYIERLKQKYPDMKGTSGCGNRLILTAYMMAAKYIHVNLKSIIINTATNTDTPLSPPTSPINSDPSHYHFFGKTKRPVYRGHHYQILRMEVEFLHFLNYDLSIKNAVHLIRWVQKYDPIQQVDYTSADERDKSE